MNRFFAALALSLSTLMATSLTAAEFLNLPGTSTLAVLGELTMNDVAIFEKHLDGNVKELLLKSNGGSLDAAWAMGAIIEKRGLKTIVPDNVNCVSACSIVFFHGSERQAGLGSKIGVHLPYFGENQYFLDICQVLERQAIRPRIRTGWEKVEVTTAYVELRNEIPLDTEESDKVIRDLQDFAQFLKYYKNIREVQYKYESKSMEKEPNPWKSSASISMNVGTYVNNYKFTAENDEMFLQKILDGEYGLRGLFGKPKKPFQLAGLQYETINIFDIDEYFEEHGEPKYARIPHLFNQTKLYKRRLMLFVVHMPETTNSDVSCLTNAYHRGAREFSRLHALLTSANISSDVLEVMVQTPSTDVYWMNHEQLLELGVITTAQ